MLRQAVLFLGLTTLVVLITLIPGQTRMTNPQVLGSATYSAADVLALVNLVRIRQSLPPLHLSAQLSAAAAAKAQDMLRLGYWSHDSVTTATPWLFIQQTGYQYALAGENLARDYSQPESIVEAWLASPPHRANLLNPVFTDTGLAIVSGTYPNGQSGTIIVEILASPLQSMQNNEKGEYLTASTLTPPFYIRPATVLIGLLLTIIIVLGTITSLSFIVFPRKPKRSSPSSTLWSH